MSNAAEPTPWAPTRVDSEALTRAIGDVKSLLATEGGQDRAVNKIMAFRPDGDVTRYTLVRMLVSIGQINRDERLVDCALQTFQRIKSKAPKDPGLYYDIANGYQTLYELRIAEGASPFECEQVVDQALKYFGKAGQDDPRVLTNRGNLHDMLGRPVEAIDCYEAAMQLDTAFGMAIGNKGMAVEYLAPIATYPATCRIYAHQLYQEALQHEGSIRQVGGDEALASFRLRDASLVRAFSDAGRAGLLDQDLRHEHYDESSLSPFVRFYTEFCVRHRLYLNLHIYDHTAAASIGDTVIPRFVTDTSERAFEDVNDIAFRLNEISESFMTARLALVQSQLTSDDLSAVSEQTTLINLYDYSASNVYVGCLKSAYKEAFGVLDKIAVLLNHYLGLGLQEDRCYYRSVWYVHGPDGSPLDPPVIAPQVKQQGWRLFGLYLLCQDLCGSRYSQIRNALTHRYLRVYRMVDGPKGTYTFEELTRIAIEALYQIKCAIMYALLFIEANEHAKHSGTDRVGTIPLSTRQHLDLWRPSLPATSKGAKYESSVLSAACE